MTIEFMECRHNSKAALCVVGECRADGLAEVMRLLIEWGSPHEDATCPEDDTCECQLAKVVNRILDDQARRLEYRSEKSREAQT
jgi:hypothetical protein